MKKHLDLIAAGLFLVVASVGACVPFNDKATPGYELCDDIGCGDNVVFIVSNGD